MKKLVFLLVLVGVLCGCANFLTTTATRGTSFGMSREKVLARLENKYKLLYQDKHILIFDGLQEQLKQPALKGFTFQNNRLVMASDRIRAEEFGENINREEAIEITNFLLDLEGFKTKEKIISADEKNIEWNHYYLSNEQFVRANPYIIQLLQSKEYWAVYYATKEINIMGDGAWVFVDKKTGEIILRFYMK